jgi:uncharacterized protein
VILYLDTSSLAKFYLDERWSDDVHRWVEMADGVACSVVAYPEACSALARARSRGDISSSLLHATLADLEGDWSSMHVLEVGELAAGRLAIDHLLRGFDAVHLAAALTLRDAVGTDGVAFSSFEAALNEAAVAEGLIVLEPG